MAASRSGSRTRKRKMWKGRATPDGVVGTGRKGAIPVPEVAVRERKGVIVASAWYYLCRGIANTFP